MSRGEDGARGVGGARGARGDSGRNKGYAPRGAVIIFYIDQRVKSYRRIGRGNNTPDFDQCCSESSGVSGNTAGVEVSQCHIETSICIGRRGRYEWLGVNGTSKEVRLRKVRQEGVSQRGKGLMAGGVRRGHPAGVTAGNGVPTRRVAGRRQYAGIKSKGYSVLKKRESVEELIGLHLFLVTAVGSGERIDFCISQPGREL